MILGAEMAGNVESVSRLEALRAALPAGPVAPEWGETFRKLLEWSFPAAYAGVDTYKLGFAVVFLKECEEWVAAGKLPDDVRDKYRRKPQWGTLGAVRDVAGAFAIARGYRPHDSTLKAADAWAAEALKIAARMGLKIPERLPAGGGSARTS